MTKQNTTNLIAITDALAGGEAGAITWWTLGGLIDPMALREAARNRGISDDDLPKDSTPKKAIRRACQNAAGKRLLARSLSSGAWAMVREREVTIGTVRTDLDYDVLLTCRVDNASETLVFDGPEKYSALRDCIEADYKRYLGPLTPNDLRAWLASVVMGSQGVHLCDRGAMYFAPKTALHKWRLVKAALREVSGGVCDIHLIPALPGSEAVESIVAALTKEAEGVTSELMAKIGAGELGGRALRARAGDCEQLASKLEAYEALLGASLDAIKGQVMATSAAAMAGALLADAEKEANTSVAA
jgi:hypothetical protein